MFTPITDSFLHAAQSRIATLAAQLADDSLVEVQRTQYTHLFPHEQGIRMGSEGVEAPG